MERNHVRVFKHIFIGRRVVVPPGGSNWLRRPSFPRPLEGFAQQGHHRVHITGVGGLVEHIPQNHPRIGGKTAHDTLFVGFQFGPGARIKEHDRTRGAQPAGIMNPRFRRGLRAGLGIVVPATIEDHEHHLDVVAVGDGKKSVHTLQKTDRILLVSQVVQIDPDDIHAQPFGPAQFFVDGRGIKRGGLPHFQFIDGGAGNEVATDEPGLLGIPFIGLFGRPHFAGRL